MFLYYITILLASQLQVVYNICLRVIFMKNTKQRTLIIDVLSRAKVPLSANEIQKRASEKQPNIALTTIYRNLEVMYENDMIDRHRIDDKEYCYELKKKNHSHFLICKKCRKKVILSECPLKELENSITKSTGFHITSHSLELEGYCGECNK